MNSSNKFSSYVVKVASRCNLNCDYCYMYQHADQSWKDKPRLLSEGHQDLFARRLKEYVAYADLKRVLIVYHGGEPLLFGADRMVQFSRKIREELKDVNCQADFGIQTNGVLLKESHLQMFERENISVSMSIDGPKEMHNQHRLDHQQRPTFDKVYAALKLLQRYPHIFQGCIAVIDPYSEPYELFTFFNDNQVKEFNILIPDANYIAPPIGRDKQPDLYKNWLLKAFDCWFDKFSHIKCKYFDALIQAVLGKTIETDSFGLGDVSLLVIETDGTYHNHDVLKITEQKGTDLGLNLENNPISDAHDSKKIQFHRHLLTKSGLSEKCQACKYVEICGGGFIAHRFSKEGYKNPSIYCEEIFTLIDHIILRLYQKMKNDIKQSESGVLSEFSENEMGVFWNSKTSYSLISKLLDHSARKNYHKLNLIIPFARKHFPEHVASIEACAALSFEKLKWALLQPTTANWLRSMYGYTIQIPVTNVMGDTLSADPDYFNEIIRFVSSSTVQDFVLQSPDRWFRYALGKRIILDHPKEILEAGLENLQKALKIVLDYDPDLYKEMSLISKHILIIKDQSASPDKDVSLSDATIPGAIFIGVWKSNGLLSPYMVAASLIHEHLHQKLYLLQNRFGLFEPQETKIYSPWPKVLRSPEGALHAVYVFTHIAEFWSQMIYSQEIKQIAEEQLNMELERLEPCIKEIKEKVAFTHTGKLFFNCIRQKFDELQSRYALMQV